jgi:aminomethyltransferase
VPRYSPLHDYHLAAGAKLADFGGWEMPIEYSANGGGVINEHTAVRGNVGLFDVSHLGKVEVKGASAFDLLNQVFTNDLGKISDGQAQYTMLCDPNSGGVVDDLIVYKISSEEFLLVPNAANTDEVVKRISTVDSSVEIRNAHDHYGVFALQGPNARKVLESLGVQIDLEYMSFTISNVAGVETIICRTGYTGEFGFELLPKWQDAEIVWESLEAAVRKVGGLVAGLGARDTLRTEMGYPLHGHELSLSITPVQAHAGWAVGWAKSNFWGKSVLEKEKAEGASRILRGLLVTERGIPRQGMPVLQNQIRIGEITSGTFSPTLKTGIALALISPEIAIGEEISIDIRGKLTMAKVIKPPFVPSHVK